MRETIKNHWPIILLLVLALATRFWHLGQPAEVVFDEVHFGKFVSAYFTHEYYFDIHPPLGKLIIAAWADFKGYDASISFGQIGDKASTALLYNLRFMPAFVSVLFVALFYFFILKIGLSKKAAFLGAFLINFDNAILTQSKFILLDIFLLFFGFLALYFFFCFKNTKKQNLKILFLSLAAMFAACAFSIKWTGVLFLGIILFFALIEILKSCLPTVWHKFSVKKALVSASWQFSILIFVPFLIYFLVFMTHFKILYKSGPGDAYMSQAFQKALYLNNVRENIAPLTNWQKFVELNKGLYSYNKGITAQHPDGSKWHQWPYSKKPIWYWSKSTDFSAKNIYLIGNPAVWWPALLAIIVLALALLRKKWREKLPQIAPLLVFGYFLNLLPYVFISRVAFLYHYLPSLVFGILALIIFADKIFKPPKMLPIYGLFLVIIFLCFLYFSPITYGSPVSPEKNQKYADYIKWLNTLWLPSPTTQVEYLE